MFGFSNNRRSNKKSSRNNRPKRRPRTFEGLEERTLFAVGAEIVDSKLVITGSDQADTVVVTRERDNIVVYNTAAGEKGPSEQFKASQVTRILFYGKGGDDSFENKTALDVWADLGGDNDTFHGGEGEDVVLGGNGIDTIHGQRGNDIIDGEAGNDFIYGGKGSDALFGGADDDWVSGEENTDFVFGGSGADKVFGDGGGDLVDGGSDETRDLVGADNPFIPDSSNEKDYLFNYTNFYSGTGNEAEDTLCTTTSVDVVNTWDHSYIHGYSKEDEFRGNGKVMFVPYRWQSRRDFGLEYENLRSLETRSLEGSQSASQFEQTSKYSAAKASNLRWDDRLKDPLAGRTEVGSLSSKISAAALGKNAGRDVRVMEPVSSAARDAAFSAISNKYAKSLSGLALAPSSTVTSVFGEITTQLAPIAAVVPKIAPSLAVTAIEPVSQTASRLAAGFTNFIPPNPVTPVATNPTSAPPVVIVVDTPVAPISPPVSSVANAILKSSTLSAAKAVRDLSGDNWGG